MAWCAVLGIAAVSARADDWPQWGGPQRDNVWRESGIIDKFPEGGAKVKWRAAVGMGYAGPAVAEGKVYVTDRILREGPASSRRQSAGVERILCFSAADGRLLWKEEYPCEYTISYAGGPRTTPLVGGGKVYTLGAEGDLQCREAETGKLVWKKQVGKSGGFSTQVWGISSSPLLDGKKLICLTGDKQGVAAAFDKDTGEPLWKALPTAQPGYCPPVIYEAGGKRQLIVWHPEALNSLDPETGEVYWSDPFKTRMGVSIAMPRKAGDLLIVSGPNEGTRVMKLEADRPAMKLLWKRGGTSEYRTEAIHSLMCTPVFKDGFIYGVCINGELRCVRAEDGERVWETLAATSPNGKPARWMNAFIVPQGDRYFLANELGDLIIARLSPKGYEEISRMHVLEPTNTDAGRPVVWSHPAFANRCVYMRNDREIVCVELAK